jgi:hypothetical protein
MTLIIEDGSGVANANTYVSVADARAYAALRGLTLPASDPAVEVLLVLACDYMQQVETRFKGERTLGDGQVLAWPRAGVFVFGQVADNVPQSWSVEFPQIYFGTRTSIDDASIPALVKAAQCQLAYDTSLTNLQPTGTGQQTLRKEVGDIKVEYANTFSTTITPRPNKALAILAPLFRSTAALTTLRT